MRIKLILLCLVELVIGEDNIKSKIGIVAKQGELPFAVALRVRFIIYDGAICSGALVKLDMIMTAAHCFFLKDMKRNVTIDEYFTIMGVEILEIITTRYIKREILLITNPIGLTKAKMDNDTAAAFLDKPYEITETVKLAKIVSGDSVKFKAAWDDIVEKKEMCRGIGWGNTYADPVNNKTLVVSFQLKYISVLPLSDEKCSNETFDDLCGKGTAATVPVAPEDSLGAGDSGGPLMCGEYVYGTVVGTDSRLYPSRNKFFLFFPFLEYFGIEGSPPTSASTQILFNTRTQYH